MMKAAVVTLGCKVNQYESAGIMEALGKQGVALVPFGGQADVTIINTCTVTGRTDYQSRQLIRRAARSNPGGAVIVTGCYAQRAPDEIARIPGVAVVAGTAEKEHIPELIRRASGEIPCILANDVAAIRGISSLQATVFPGHTRAFLKIQDGCNAFCSYCIVPYARGRSRSLPEAEIICRLQTLAVSGYREVVLTGIHLGAYGQDLTTAPTLLQVLETIEQNEVVERLRLSSLEPTEIPDDLIALMQEARHISHHLHIPLQSGDNGILGLMKRDYDAAFFKSLIGKLVRAIPDLAVGIDVMAGFPGEGEREFSHTAELIEDLPIAYLHVFPYSERPGTLAATLPGKVEEGEKKKRGAILRNLGKKKRERFARRFRGTKLAVLIEGRKDPRTGCLLGYSGNYLPLAVADASPQDVNQIVTVVPEEYRDGKLFGRIAHD